jgi:hypothetical protein
MNVTMEMKERISFTFLLSYKIFCTVFLWKHVNNAVVNSHH